MFFPEEEFDEFIQNSKSGSGSSEFQFGNVVRRENYKNSVSAIPESIIETCRKYFGN